MTTNARELSEFIRNTGDGQTALAASMEGYYEWGGPFEPEQFLERLEWGVVGAAKVYVIAYGDGHVGNTFRPADVDAAIAMVYEEVKSRYSMSDVARSLFLTLQTDGQVYQKSVTPLIEECRMRAQTAPDEACRQLDEQIAHTAFKAIVTAFVPSFERQQARFDEPCKVTPADIEQVTRELKGYYFDEAGIRRLMRDAPEAAAPVGRGSHPPQGEVNFGLPITLAVARDDGDFSVAATFNNQGGAVPEQTFRDMVMGFVSAFREAGNGAGVVLVNREDAPAMLDEFDIQEAVVRDRRPDADSDSPSP